MTKKNNEMNDGKEVSGGGSTSAPIQKKSNKKVWIVVGIVLAISIISLIIF